MKEIVKPDAIPIGELIKLIDGRIPRFEQKDFVLIIHNGHLIFTTKDEIEDTNQRIEKTRLDAFYQSMKQMFEGN